MAEHTPGPWQIKHAVDGSGDVGITAAGLRNVLAECFFAFRDPGEREHGEAEANARLIAAAPDLLAALKLLAADVEGYEAWQRPCHALDVAIEVIAKAESR